MLENILSWFKENFGFLYAKGSVFSGAVGLATAAAFYHYFVEGDGTTPEVIGELALIAIFVSLFAMFVGWTLFQDKWPALNFGNFWEEINTPDPQTEPKEEAFTNSSGEEAVDMAIRIMTEARAAQSKNRGEE